MFNPRGDWADPIITLANDIRQNWQHFSFRIIVVNDGSSTDFKHGFEKISENIPEFKWLSYPNNRGKGYAIRHGVKTSDADYIVYTDIDVPYTWPSMDKVLKEVVQHEVDLAIGIRGESYYSQLPPLRKSISSGLRQLNGFLFRLKVTDTQGGLKAMNAKMKPTFLDGKIDRYLFDLEFIKLASRNNSAVIKGVPVELKPDIELPSFSPTILLKESKNLMFLLFR